MDAVVYTTVGQEYEMLSGILEEEAPGLTVSRGRMIDSFESLAKFTADKEQRYQQLEMVHLSKRQKLNQLKELSKMYALYAPIQAVYKESQSLNGLAKMRYDKEHTDSLSKYAELKERMQSLLQNGGKITPKQWKAKIQSLQAEYDSISKEQSKTAAELAYAEVIAKTGDRERPCTVDSVLRRPILLGCQKDMCGQGNF